MAKHKKCICHEFVRDEDKHFLLTNHHPECPHFNPASELYDMEMQCKKFMQTILDLKHKLKEMQQIVEDSMLVS